MQSKSLLSAVLPEPFSILPSPLPKHQSSSNQSPTVFAAVNEASDWVLMSASFDPIWRVRNDLCTILPPHKLHRHKQGIVCSYRSSCHVLCFQTVRSDALICTVSLGNRLLREFLLPSPALLLQVQAPLRRKLTCFYSSL